MDPLTHCLLGAVTSQAFFSRRLGRLAPLIGALAGLLPDIDRLLQFPSHPMLTMSLHQQFTHTLWFIPLGGLLAMLPFFWLKQLRYRRRALYGATVLSYAVHCVFDVLSTHGTAVLWPVLDYRVALDWLAYFDPLLIVILLAGMSAGLIRNRPRVCHIAFIAVLLYAGVGATQHERAMTSQQQLMDARYHTAIRRRVIPTQNNLIIWRSMYQMNFQVYVDAIRVPISGDQPAYRQGDWTRTFSPLQLPKPLQESQQVQEAQKFVILTNQWAAFVPNRMGIDAPLLDIRTAATPEGFDSTTGVKFNEDSPDQPMTWVHLTPENPTPWADRWHDLTSPTAPRQPEAQSPYTPTKPPSHDFVPIPKPPVD